MVADGLYCKGQHRAGDHDGPGSERVSLSALPTALLIPPVNLVPLGIAGLLVARRWPRLGRAMMAVSLAGLLVFSLPVTSALLTEGLEASVPHVVPEAPGGAGEAIIVLSAEGTDGVAGSILPPRGVGPMTAERMRAGVILSRRLGLPLLVTGGPPEAGMVPIAEEMARSLREDFGLAAAWVEPKANDTWENAAYSIEILRAAGIRRAYVVSNGWHLRRAMIAFRHFNFDAVPVAARFEGGPRYKVADFIPRVSALERSYYALHEWIGCVYYVLRG